MARVDPALADPRAGGARVKPSAAGLGVDLGVLDWRRSGTQCGAFEIAFVAAWRGEELASVGPERALAAMPGDGAVPPGGGPGGAVDWVLLRVAGDPDGRVLVYDRTEWQCFVDGVGRGEFDMAGG